jgi:anaerobic magnesium-protoporphyrin IX monomethyl ester cyclase
VCARSRLQRGYASRTLGLVKVALIRPPAAQRLWLQLLSGPGLPLGLAYIAAVAEQEGHEVTVIDGYFLGHDRVVEYGPGVLTGLSSEDIIARIPVDADVVGVSVLFTMDWLAAADLCLKIREARPGVPVVLGGEHITALPIFSLLTARADIAVLGEGEATFAEVLRALDPATGGSLARACGLEGTAHRAGDKVVVHAPRARIDALDTLPRPAWHHFDIEGHARIGLTNGGFDQGGPSLPILTTRGCPYQCTFCPSASMWGGWKPRSATDVADEMEWAQRTWGVADFRLYDLTAVIKRPFAEALCNEIIRRGINTTWQIGIGTRIESIDDDLARLMKRSGLAYAAMAPESGSGDTRERVKKELDESDVGRATTAALNAGIAVQYLIVLGFPEDTWRDLYATYILAWEAGRRGVQNIGPNVFTPLPGTELWDDLINAGKLRFDEGALFASISNYGFVPEYVMTEKIPPAAVVASLYGVVLTFYASRAVHHPGVLFDEVWRGAAKGEDTGLITRIARSLADSVKLVRGLKAANNPFRGPAIDYSRFAATDVTRAAAARERYLPMSFSPERLRAQFAARTQPKPVTKKAA